MLPALMLTAAVMFVCGLVCMSRRVAPVTFFKCSLTALAASHCILGIEDFRSAKRSAELAAKYPLESMADRLVYESRRKPRAQGAEQNAAVQPVLLQSNAWSEISVLEEKVEVQVGSTAMRHFNLRLLHDNAVADFINSPGFSITRRIEPRSEYIELILTTATKDRGESQVLLPVSVGD